MADNNNSNWFSRLFGFTIDPPQKDDERRVTFSEPLKNDGALELEAQGGFYNYGTNLDYETPQDEVQLITKYRDLANQPEFNKAIQNIVNEAFSYDENSFPVSIDLSNVNISDKTKKIINEEFEDILRMLNFKTEAYDIFRKWYIDGRLYYHKIIDTKSPKKGILEIRYIDPRKIRKVREKKKDSTVSGSIQGIEINQRYNDYYIFNPAGINSANIQGLKIAPGTICFVPSGLLTKDNKTVISYIHQSIRFFNSLRQLEDAMVMYRLARASEKRVFNVEVGDLNKPKAEQYLQTLIDRFRKKITYNPETGEVMEQKRFMSMQEDYWFPKRDGKGTSVDVLSGAQNLGELDDVNYMKQKLYESLNVPVGRLDPASMAGIGRSSEITRDELGFQKFIDRLRKKFNLLFDDLLKTQLILKKIITDDEWNDVIARDIKYDYLQDNFFSELKWTEIRQGRFAAMRDAMDANTNGFVSKKWIAKNILMLNEDEIKELKKEIDEEKAEAEENGDNENQGQDNTQDNQEEPKPMPVKIIPDDAEKE